MVTGDNSMCRVVVSWPPKVRKSPCDGERAGVVIPDPDLLRGDLHSRWKAGVDVQVFEVLYTKPSLRKGET